MPLNAVPSNLAPAAAEYQQGSRLSPYKGYPRRGLLLHGKLDASRLAGFGPAAIQSCRYRIQHQGFDVMIWEHGSAAGAVPGCDVITDGDVPLMLRPLSMFTRMPVDVMATTG